MIDGLFDERPWLKKEFNPRNIDEVVLNEFEYNLLNVQNETELVNRQEDSSILVPKKRIFFYNMNGVQLAEVGFKREKTEYRFLFWKWNEEEQVSFIETVGDALKRISDKGEVYYIVSATTNKDGVRTMFFTQPAEGKTIHQMILQEKERGKNFIKAKLR